MLLSCSSKWITQALSESGHELPSVSPVTSEQTSASSIDLALFAPWCAINVKDSSLYDGTTTPFKCLKLGKSKSRKSGNACTFLKSCVSKVHVMQAVGYLSILI